MREEYVRGFNNMIIGIIRYDTNGDLIALDFPSRKILGYYRKKIDYTTDFLGHLLYKGNNIGLLFTNK